MTPNTPTNPLWRGPLVDGISQSMISKFIQCPYRFYLYAILGLKDDTPLHPNLIWGDCFHKGLEILLLSLSPNYAIEMMFLYLDEKYPQAPPTYKTSLARGIRNYNLDELKDSNWQTEIVFDQIHSIRGHNVRLRGKLDGLTVNHPRYGTCLIEHKTKGYIDLAQTRSELDQDLQLNFYMQLHNVDWVIYDLILIPESQKYVPARNYNETPQEWMERLHTGPCGKYNIFPVNSNKGMWQQRTTQAISPEKREAYWDQFIIPTIARMCEWWDYVTLPSFDYTNPACFDSSFYRMPPRMFNGSFTEKFQCEYYKLLIGEQTVEDLVPIRSLFNELEEPE